MNGHNDFGGGHSPRELDPASGRFFDDATRVSSAPELEADARSLSARRSAPQQLATWLRENGLPSLRRNPKLASAGAAVLLAALGWGAAQRRRGKRVGFWRAVGGLTLARVLTRGRRRKRLWHLSY